MLKYYSLKTCKKLLLTECHISYNKKLNCYKASLGSNQIYNADRNYLLRLSILKITFFLDEYNPCIAERWYYILHEITSYLFPNCLHCNKSIKFNRINKGYRKYCSVKCQANSKETKEKKKKTNLKKYGVKHYLQSDDKKEKTKKTNLKKYGVEYVSQNKKIRKKIEKTNLKKYGFKQPTKSKEIKEKTEQTNLKRYGYKSHNSSPDFKKKKKKALIKKYGVENINQLEKTKKKIKETNLKRYGYTCPMQQPKVKEKRDKGIRKPETKEKKKQTCLKKYGTTSPAKSKKIQEKASNTYFEKTGYWNPSQNPDSLSGKNYTKYGKYKGIGYRSVPELEFLELLDSLNLLKYINKKQVRFFYIYYGNSHYYIPDFQITFPDNSIYIIEIKATHQYFYKDLGNGKLFHKWDIAEKETPYFFILNNEIKTKQQIINEYLIPHFIKNYLYL